MYIEINIESGVPIYLQIAGQVKQIAAAGGLEPGEKLPSVRSLALKLRINPNTVQAAYRHLETEGIVETKKGLGVFLASGVKKLPLKAKVQAVGSLIDQAILKARQLGLAEERLLDLLKTRLETSPGSRADKAETENEDGGSGHGGKE
jgi:GntR family transcriptional regulator